MGVLEFLAGLPSINSRTHAQTILDVARGRRMAITLVKVPAGSGPTAAQRAGNAAKDSCECAAIGTCSAAIISLRVERNVPPINPLVGEDGSS